MQVKDKVVVVTGGASGLGLATARYLVQEKSARVAIFDANAEAGAAAAIYAEDPGIVFGVADADEMLVKAQLAAKIAEIIKLRKLTQTQAASLLGMTQPKLSNLLRGRFRGISEAKMLACMTLLGRDVKIIVKPAPRSRKAGHVSVLFA